MIHTCDDCQIAWCENCDGYGPCSHGPSLCELHGLACPECRAEYADDHDAEVAEEARHG